jgi:pSer/pThr/pTyr-binding forkhead associated (FHA) protein
MAKLVLLSEGFTGRSHELIAEKTTIGRVEDNTFQIADPSVSSHHCEVHLRGSEVVVKDLNSTNGTFIETQQITGEGVVKPGQILRLGQIQIRLEAPGAATGPAAPKKIDSTLVMDKRGGVKLEQLEQGSRGAVDPKVFAKKKNGSNVYWLIGGVILVVIIAGGLWVAFHALNK